ncbi:hypothetical protein [Rhodoplanes sp. Z2-YC6860]|uniref:hypothetical protein n=1 Tax=Rhodoplanes sp. Z2-YC6860 TaxID=674703 RepID=UPI00078E79A0|nr:hypothetical protein [Rhodoplanes sp. Z2-YC6860]AMN39718.1 hypothetical protein RHPLAN_12610 [Rhodoplanes sp. Z2-YC6860]
MTRAGAALALSGAIFLATTVSLMAMDNGIPKIDVEKRCRASQHTSEKILGTVPSPNAFDACLRDEQAARGALVRSWANMTAATKALCVQPMVFSASYIEWRECVEMEGHVQALKKK